MTTTTTPEIEIIQQALLYLDGRCDGAVKEDRVGFNGRDTGFGKSLAARVTQGITLTDGQAEAALNMLRIYTRQLAAGGITLPKDIGVRTPPHASVTAQGDLLELSFPYNPALLAQIKEIPGRRWNPDKKVWTVPYGALGTVRGLLPDAHYDLSHPPVQMQTPLAPVGGRIVYRSGKVCVHLAQGPSFRADLETLNRIVPRSNRRFNDDVNGKYHAVDVGLASELLAAFPDYERENIPAAWGSAPADPFVSKPVVPTAFPSGRVPRKHQVEGAEALVEDPFRILGDDMGLGKTFTTLMAARAFLEAGIIQRVIVVCPVSLKRNWAIEAEFVGIKVEPHSWAKVPAPSEDEPYAVIYDEAHYAQSLKARRTQAAIALSQHPLCRAAWLLTGTPIKNGRPANLYPLLVMAKHELANDKRYYEVRYCGARTRNVGFRSVWDTRGSTNLRELHERIRNKLIRRMKADCLDLPPKTRIFRSVELDAEAKQKYQAAFDTIRADYLQRKARGEISSHADAIVLLGQLRRAGSMAKVGTAIEMIEEALEQADQTMVYVEFRETGAEIERRLIAQGVPCEYLHGGVSEKLRQPMMDRFQSGQSKVFIMTRAGGVGITLTRGTVGILVDRPWTPGDAEQIEDRLHRIGQDRSVFVWWLQHGEVDTRVDTLLADKYENIEMVLAGKRRQFAGLWFEEMALELLEEVLA